MITQLNAFVNAHGPVYQKEFILLCVNYTSKRADYKIFTEGSNVCVCVPQKGSMLTVTISIIIKINFILFFFLLNCPLIFSQRNRYCFNIFNCETGSTKDICVQGTSRLE